MIAKSIEYRRVVSYSVRCDGCGKTVPVASVNHKRAIAEATRYQYVKFPGKIWACPRCAKKVSK